MPRSLVFATDIDVLPVDRIVTRRDGYLVIRSPSNPQHYWGNWLLFDDPPRAGDGVRWEERFDAEFGEDPRIRHRSFGWDRIDDALGEADEQFVSRGYRLEDTIGLIAPAERVRPHERENGDVVVRSLDPAVAADEGWWDAIVELQVDGREPELAEASHRTFTRARLEDLRALFRAGRGAWFVAHYPGSAEPVASCGVVVTGDRGRFQTVDTVASYRRRGICSRLVVDAARQAAERHRARSFVIAAEAGYHALGLYESLGFERREHVHGVCHWPSDLSAAS